ncbi:MAG: hypothetical protein EOM12_06650 [Verrucomicrobiae bacterium]|nr:hypothetical protein [Verrucomicrobiae bacterium]
MSFIFILLIPVFCYGIPMLIGLLGEVWLLKIQVKRELVISCCVPIILWLIMVSVFVGKSLSNAIWEPVILAGAILVLIFAYGIITRLKLMETGFLGMALIAMSVVTTIAVLLHVPAFPE